MAASAFWPDWTNYHSAGKWTAGESVITMRLEDFLTQVVTCSVPGKSNRVASRVLMRRATGRLHSQCGGYWPYGGVFSVYSPTTVL